MILAGLVDKQVEVFVSGSDLLSTNDGNVKAFIVRPESIKKPFRDRMNSDPVALQALKEWGIPEGDPMLCQYTWCNFGGCDLNPDMDANGILHPEYWECGQRGKCPYEGRVCCNLKVKNGVLTCREIEIVKAISKGLADKEIANLLGIEVTTMVTHNKNIKSKMGMQSRTEIAVWAAKNIIGLGS